MFADLIAFLNSKYLYYRYMITKFLNILYNIITYMKKFGNHITEILWIQKKLLNRQAFMDRPDIIINLCMKFLIHKQNKIKGHSITCCYIWQVNRKSFKSSDRQTFLIFVWLGLIYFGLELFVIEVVKIVGTLQKIYQKNETIP